MLKRKQEIANLQSQIKLIENELNCLKSLYKGKMNVGLAQIAVVSYLFMMGYVMAVAKNIQIKNIEYEKYNSK